jgi:hypothetical protein
MTQSTHTAWHRATKGSWERIAEGASFNAAWGLALEVLNSLGGRGGDTLVLPVGEIPAGRRVNRGHPESDTAAPTTPREIHQ